MLPPLSPEGDSANAGSETNKQIMIKNRVIKGKLREALAPMLILSMMLRP